MPTLLTPPTTDRVDAPVSAPSPAPAAPPAPRAAPAAPRREPKHLVTRRRAVIGGAVLLVGAATAWALRPTSLGVDAARAAPAPMTVTVDADAVTRVRSRFTIGAPVTGLVQRILLSEGDSVRPGEVVAVVAPLPVDPTARGVAESRRRAAAGAMSQADARRRQAALSLAQAEREAARARQLLVAGAVAERDVERAALVVEGARGDLAAAEAQRRAAAAELAQAGAALDATVGAARAATAVRAPAAGRVLRIPDRSARVVAAGTPLMELGDPSSLEVAADVLSSDAASVRVGQRVALRGWGGDVLLGRVRRVEPSARTRVSALGVDEQRLTVVIDLANPPATLGDGYRLEASVVVWEAASVLTVPASALLRAGDRWQVYAIEGGRARRRDVQVGHLGGGLAEVRGGLRAGDSVVVFPSDALRDGARVRAGGE